MSYYFPGLISSFPLPQGKNLDFKFTTNTGENALRLLLRSFNLKPNSIVAAPEFVCNAVKRAIEKEGLKPLLFDIYPDKSYWTNYDKSNLEKGRPSVIILAHLYGFPHPETATIIEYSEVNKIFLIHDLAQSFGLDESKLNYGSIFYSFGPGKSTTAAGGGIIKEIGAEFYKKNIKKPGIWADAKAMLFMKSRIYGYTFSSIEKLMNKIMGQFNTSEEITSMSSLQKHAAAYVMSIAGAKGTDRITRYNLLSNAIKEHPLLSLPANSSNGLYFKFIVFVNDNVGMFKEYLKCHNVPYFALFTKEFAGNSNLQNFKNNAFRFIELSTEASIDIAEIKGIAEILKAYK